MFSLADKVALVTGAASGIGEAIVRAYAEAGAFVYVADRDEAGGRRVAETIHGAFLPCDVSREDACRQAIQTVLDTHGRCDILVNNAGIGHVGTALTTTGDDLDRLYAVNVKGVLFCSQAVLPGMIERRSGSIVNLASIGGVIAVRDRLAYCATKFAVVGLTKSMALDHADSQVRVNCLCPGRVETPFVQARIAEYPDPQKAYAEMAATQALGRMARPEEIAAAALYLASDESAFVTGSALIIDGGWSAGK
ncbi:MAG: SDR family oxidoreductase [Armatimonadetes bacterium]|nr:SDR family oxidoreductase [Armatimonadota bacterium]